MDLLHANCFNSIHISTNSLRRSGRVGTGASRSSIRRFVVSNAAVETSVNDAATGRTSTGKLAEKKKKAMELAKSSTALELLDIERGVCVPFRKYSPETVRLEYSNYLLYLISIF